jgi:hypothetical protein
VANELSEADLDEIAARAEAALPGPWEAFVGGGLGGEEFIRTGGLDDGAPDLYVTASHRGDEVPTTAPTAVLEFIAGARQDVPRLIAEIRRLRST